MPACVLCSICGNLQWKRLNCSCSWNLWKISSCWVEGSCSWNSYGKLLVSCRIHQSALLLEVRAGDWHKCSSWGAIHSTYSLTIRPCCWTELNWKMNYVVAEPDKNQTFSLHDWAWTSTNNFLRTSWNQLTVIATYKCWLFDVLMKLDTRQNARILTLWTKTIAGPNCFWNLCQLQVFEKTAM